MLVQNTEARLVGINAGKCRVLLKPGVNLVPDTDWDQVKGTKFAIAKLAAGALKELAAPKEAGPGKASTLGEMSAVEAIKVVGETLDEELLGKWLDEEERKTVVEAIERQLEKLAQA